MVSHKDTRQLQQSSPAAHWPSPGIDSAASTLSQYGLPFEAPPAPPYPLPTGEIATDSLLIHESERTSFTGKLQRDARPLNTEITRLLGAGDIHGAMSHLSGIVARFQNITTLLPPVKGQKLHRAWTPPLPSARDFSQWSFRLRDIFMQSGLHKLPLGASMSAAHGMVQRSTTRSSLTLWRPAGLPEHVATEDIAQHELCAFGLASLYDACLAMGYQPEEDMVAVILACLSHVVSDAKEFDAIVELAMSQLAPRAAPLAQLQLPLVPISAAIVGYGRLGHPGSGEHLLATQVRSRLRQAGETPRYHPEMAIPLNGWSQDLCTWTSLVRARALDRDISGAKRWFRIYRSAVVNSNDDRVRLSSHERRSHASVYLTLMDAIARQGGPDFAAETTSLTGKLSQRRKDEVKRVIELAHRDGVEPSPALLNFILSFERRSDKNRRRAGPTEGRGASALAPPSVSALADKVTDMMLDQKAQPDWDSHAYRQAFDRSGVTSHDAEKTGRAGSPAAPVNSVRTLCASLLKAERRMCREGERRVPSGIGRWRRSSLLHPATLRSGFLAALRQSDWPLALIVLDISSSLALGLSIFDLPRTSQCPHEYSSSLGNDVPAASLNLSTISSDWHWCGCARQDASERHWLPIVIADAMRERMPDLPPLSFATTETEHVDATHEHKPLLVVRHALRKALLHEVSLSRGPSSTHGATWAKNLCSQLRQVSDDDQTVKLAMETVSKALSLPMQLHHHLH
ncbi:unnamed protein product [Parajaminaea phylloscopi]